MTTEQLDLAADLTLWLPLRSIPEHFPAFTYNTLGGYIREHRRNPRDAIHHCTRLMGKRMFVNTKLLGQYMAGQLD